jgi:hypothetical protein
MPDSVEAHHTLRLFEGKRRFKDIKAARNGAEAQRSKLAEGVDVWDKDGWTVLAENPSTRPATPNLP